MTILRNCKMYTFRVTHKYTQNVYDSQDERVGSVERNFDKEIKAVAASEDIARAIVEENLCKVLYPDFKTELVKTEEAPYITLIIPY